MIHLFNKTYIEIDDFLDTDIDRIVISEVNGYPLLDIFSKISNANLMSFGTKVSEIIGNDKKFKTFIDMFEYCYNHNIDTNRKVIIYCQKESFIEVICNFFKIVFADIDSISSYRIVKAAFARSILLGDRTVLLINDKVLAAQPEFTEFNSVFSSINVDMNKCSEFCNKVKKYLSIEYMLSSYYYNESFKEEIKDTIRSMINRNVEEQLKEAWRTIQTNILSVDVQKKLGTKIYTIDNILEMVDDPVLSALKKTNAWRASGGISLPREQMDLTNFTDQEIAIIKEQLKTFHYFLTNDNFTIPYYQRIELYIDKIRKTKFTDQDLNEILTFEHTYEDDDRFWSLRDRSNINIYLIEYLLEQFKINNKENIKPYLLR